MKNTIRIDVKSSNRFIIIKGKTIRAPCTFDVNTESELNFYKTNFEAQGINFESYPTPEPIKQEPIKPEPIKVIKPKVQEKISEQIKTNKPPLTILDKLEVNESIEGLTDEKNRNTTRRN